MRAAVAVALSFMVASCLIPIAMPGSEEAEAGTAVEPSSPWSAYQGNNQHSGLSTYNASSTLPSVRWSTLVDDYQRGRSLSYPIITVDGRVLIRIDADRFEFYGLTAVGAGSVSHVFGDGLDFCYDPSLGPDGTIYAGASLGTRTVIDEFSALVTYAPGVVRYDPNGTLLASLELPEEWSPQSAPVVSSEGSVYMVSTSANYRSWGVHEHSVILTSLTGDLTWKWNYTIPLANAVSEPSIDAVPSIAPNGQVLFSTPLGLYSIWPNGSLAWTFGSGGMTTPVIAPDGTIFVSSLSGSTLFCLSAEGRLDWEYSTKGANSDAAITPTGNVLLNSEDGILYCLDSTGNLQWRTWIGEPGQNANPPIVSADGIIFLATGNGTLVSLDADGNERWNMTLPKLSISSLALGSDGTLYAPAGNVVYAINAIPPSKPQSPRVGAHGDGYNHLYWYQPATNGSGPLLGYNIYRDAGLSSDHGIDYVLIATVGPGTSAYNDTTAPASSSGNYQIIAFNYVGEGAAANADWLPGNVHPSYPSPPPDLLLFADIGAAVGLICLILFVRNQKWKIR